MDMSKQLDFTRDLLDGNLNRMSVTDDLEELDDMFYFAKQRVEEIYKANKERLEEAKKFAQAREKFIEAVEGHND